MVKNSPVHAGAPSPWIGKMLWRRKWQPTPVCCPGKSHGQRSLVGYSPWGHKDIAPKQRPQTGGNRLDNGQKEDLQSQGRPRVMGKSTQRATGSFPGARLILRTWQGGAPGPAKLGRGTSALSHALRTRCWNNHFLGSPQRILLSCHESAKPLCGEGRLSRGSPCLPSGL